MSAATLTLLKIAFLVLLYLFLFRAVRAVYLEISPKRAVTPPAAPPRAGAAPPPSAVSASAVRGAAAGPAAPGVGPPADPNTTRRARRARVPHLRMLAPEPGRDIELGGEVVVGRGAGCTVQIDDTYASQAHARFRPADAGWQVEDLGSTNGTFVNGERIARPTRLRKGDQVTIGQTVLEMRP